MIKNHLQTLLCSGALFLACSLPNVNIFAAQQTAHVKQTSHVKAKQMTHVRASSHEDQVSLAQGHHLVKLEHFDSGFKIVQISDDKFRVEKSGTYFVIATGQAGVNIVSPPGYLDFWLIKNDVAVPNSGARVFLPNLNSTAIAIFQTVLELNRNDIISIAYSSSNSSIGLFAIQPSSPNEPVIPSATLSAILMRP